MAAVASDALKQLSPALMSGTFLAFLAALTVNTYLVALVDQFMSLIHSVLPMHWLDNPVGRIIHTLISMLLALFIVGLVYAFVIRPVYKRGHAIRK